MIDNQNYKIDNKYFYESALKKSIDKIRVDIDILNSQKEEILKAFNAKSQEKISKLKAKISKLKEQLVIEGSRVEKTVIKSPVDGYLNRSYINSLHEAVHMGDKVAEIVPVDSSLIIKAKVLPKDIAFLKPDQEANIKLSAYDYNIYGFLRGKIVDISLDVFVDKEKENRSYYLVKIESNKGYLEHNGKRFKIIPGMVADVDILIGKRKIIDYIFLPIKRVFSDAGKEV
jgi:adhesin transport system membrane fusion protein